MYKTINPPKEKDIEKTIMKGLRWHGIYCQKVHSGAMLKPYRNKAGQKFMYKVKMADEGTPDVFTCVPIKITKSMVGKTIGAFVAVEVKRDEKEIRRWGKQKDERAQNQYAQHRIIEKAGGVVIIAPSLNEVLNDLKSISFLS